MKVSTKNIKHIKSCLEYLYDNFNIDTTAEKIGIGDVDIRDRLFFTVNEPVFQV